MTSSRNFINMQNKYDRVVLLIDMDCFYCQVEEKLNADLVGKPIAVVQYNAWRGGGIIAVNYAARAKGVTRHMRGDEAKEQCPDIILVKVPNVREKADLTKYREAGKEVAAVLQKYTQLLERASVDEAYLDITESVNKRLEDMNSGSFVLKPNELVGTYAVGYEDIGDYITEITGKIANIYRDDDAYHFAYDENDILAVRNSDIRLLIGASIASEIRAAVKTVTTYECSAGIAHNKILAKLACGMNKPNKQTILPLSQIAVLFETLPVSKIKGLGAKFGEEICERLSIKYLGQLIKFSEAELQRKLDEKSGTWLYYISRGIDLEAVTPRFYSKSIGCCKKFPGRNMITGLSTLNHWLQELAEEISDRIEKDLFENNRRARQMVVSYIQEFCGEEVSSSRSAPLTNCDKETLAKSSLDVIKANTKQFFRMGSESVLNNPIKFLGISVGKFETINNSQTKLQEMFANQAAKKKRGRVEESSSCENIAENKIPIEASPAKKKSFFANYLIKKTLETEENDEPEKVSVKSDLHPPAPALPPPEVKSFFVNALNKQKLERELQRELAIKQKLALENEINKNIDVHIATVEMKGFANFPNEHNSLSIHSSISTKDNQKDKSGNQPSDIADAQQKSFPEKRKGFFTKFMQKYKEREFDQKKCEADTKESERKEIDGIQSQPEESFSAMSTTDLTSSPSESSTLNLTLETSSSNKRILTTSPVNQPTTLDYQSNYAELATPDLRNEFFVKCETCGAKVLSDERTLQSHRDRHFAEQLSQQQRQEFRQEIKKKFDQNITSPNSTNKKAKKSSSVAGAIDTKSEGDIKKFLTKTTSLDCANVSLSFEPSTSSQAAAAAAQQQTVFCSECNQNVKAIDMAEHSDFHVAKKLQRSLNQLEVRTIAIVKKPNAKNNQSKRLNLSIASSRSTSSSSVLSSSPATTKPISKFFSQAQQFI